jgi:hypothetical protein
MIKDLQIFANLIGQSGAVFYLTAVGHYFAYLFFFLFSCCFLVVVGTAVAKPQ